MDCLKREAALELTSLLCHLIQLLPTVLRIDPTVRFDSYLQQPINVHTEKCRIYYLGKYKLSPIEVIGLMIWSKRHNNPDISEFL